MARPPLFVLLVVLSCGLVGCPVAGAPDEPTCDASVDRDGDGLDECAEAEWGTDDGSADTDEDGYSDGDEVLAGSDPADDEDVIYVGGWPFNADKDSFEDPGFGTAAAEDGLMPRYRAVDQFGDEVDLFDFLGWDKPIMLDKSAEWCGPCHQMAEWIDGQAGPAWLSDYTRVREAVEDGEMYWITVLIQDQQLNVANAATVERWYTRHPTPGVPVVADVDQELDAHIPSPSIPSLTLVLPDGVYYSIHDQGRAIARAQYWLETNLD
jgi:thiol-disulfide isomerase/thioredoxin